MAQSTADHPSSGTATRRDFLDIVTWSTVAIGGASLVWPLIDQMNPSADVLAMATTEVDLGPIAEGSGITVTWQGKPVFIKHRTQAEIQEAEAVPLSQLRDPEPDSARVQRPEWLVMVGICTHLGCVPLGTRSGEPKGNFGGWFCPCHGSHYDTSGRVRQGPAPINLVVPTYAFTGDSTITIG